MREGRPRTAAGAPCEFIAAESPTYERRLRFENRAEKKKKGELRPLRSMIDILDKPGTDGRRASPGLSPLPAPSSRDLAFHGDVISEDRPLQLTLRDPRASPPLPGCSY